MITPKNLLIVRIDRIGDVVLSLPLAQMVKKQFPQCKITYLVREYTRPLVNSHPSIDDVIVLEEHNGKTPIKSNVKKISEYNFDTCVVVYPTFITSLIIFLARIKNRIGTGYRWYSFLFNRRVFAHRKYAEKHELEFNVDLLRELGIKADIDPGNVNFGLFINQESKTEVDNLLSENNIDLSKPIIVIHPGSGGSAIDLPISKFKKLITIVTHELDVSIILTGSNNEKELCESLVVSNKVFNTAGKFDLSGLIALINKCDIFIANSTGPIHIAAALGKYIIGFYPKILSCSAQRWGPYTNKSSIFTPAIECSNCTREQCERLDCMSSIKIDEVYLEIKKILKT